MIERLHLMLSTAEFNVALSLRKLNDWDKRQHYLEQSILHGKQMTDGESKMDRVFHSMAKLGDLFQEKGKVIEAKIIMEENYIYLSEKYDPKHPLVLKAGANLIQILALTGAFYDAERFSRICYEGITRKPLDPDSYEAARAAMNLAHA